MKWWERFGALGVALVLMVASALSLERENVEGSGAFVGAGFVVLGVWVTAELYERWDRRKKGEDDDDQ